MVASPAERQHRPGCMHWRRSEEGEGKVGMREEQENVKEVKTVGKWKGEEIQIEVCKLVVHWRRQIGSGSQVVRLSESKANSLQIT